MSHNYYSEIYLHLVWHTKGSLPLLTARIEPLVYRALRQRIAKTPNVTLHALGGIETHVHLAVTVPPTLLVADWIGQIKGGSAHDVNNEIGLQQKSVQWQSGYGVVSFGEGDLAWVVRYVERQREHHQQKGTFARLECFDNVNAGG